MVKAIFAVLFLLFIYCDISCAQVVPDNDVNLIKKFDFEDKEMSEFFDRFNFTEQVKFANNLQSSRKRNIISLLNLKDSALYHGSWTNNFIKFVSNDSNKVYLHYEDGNWFALAMCSFGYHGEIIPLTLVMKPEGTSTSGYKWVIADVKGDIFQARLKSRGSTVFIDPADHETDFQELAKALKKRQNIYLYSSKEFVPDPLSAFFAMIKNGDLKFHQIDSIEFQFLQVSGWFFVVKNFSRSEYNSGWLIASVKKMTDAEKIGYVKNHFTN